MIPVDDSWPDYWASVETGLAMVGSTLQSYLAHDHDHVVDWLGRHWDLLEPLVDDPALEYVRFYIFDGDQLSYRFQVIATYLGGMIRLVEFKPA